MTHREKRRSERFPSEEPVSLRWRGSSGEPHFGRGKVLDFSETGLRVELAQPIDPLSFVLVGPPGQNKGACAGKVRYCVAKQTKYQVGLQLSPRTTEET